VMFSFEESSAQLSGIQVDSNTLQSPAACYAFTGLCHRSYTPAPA
jgi:hypothetical protein